MAALRLCVLPLWSATAAGAAPPPADALAACTGIIDDAARLACYDRIARPDLRPELQPELQPAAGVPQQGTAASPVVTQAATTSTATEASLLDDRWALGKSDTRFDLRAHRPSYFLLGRYSTAPNKTPASPTQPAPSAALDIDRLESKYQISMKVKLFDVAENAALWAGYTQQSNWQLYNSRQSRPFRETNYEPELMLALEPNYEILGWHWRLLVLGLNHQSNGRADPLSRSWNRVYAQFGLEQGNFGLLIRPWLRIPERRDNDDNPDLTHYMGHGDIVAVYRWGEQTVSALGRYNISTGKGAVQLGWNFPLARRVRGYVQAFSGYGESLIDYNVIQNTIGVGISLADFL